MQEQLEGDSRVFLQQINDLREGQNQVSETVRKMLDEVKDKQQVRSSRLLSLG